MQTLCGHGSGGVLLQGCRRADFHAPVPAPSPAIGARETDRELSDIIYASSMREKARFLQPDLTGHVELVPYFKKEGEMWSVEFKVGAAHKYVVKNIRQLVEAMDRNEQVTYGKSCPSTTREACSPPEAGRS